MEEFDYLYLQEEEIQQNDSQKEQIIDVLSTYRKLLSEAKETE